MKLNQSDFNVDNYSISESYILGKDVPNYSGYCPITQITVFAQPDGTFRGGSPGNEKTYTGDEFINPPGFLVLHLATIDEDYTVETAVDALYKSLWSMFAGCDIVVRKLVVRTTIELKYYFDKYGDVFSHIIIIGHGEPNGIRFLDKNSIVSDDEFARLIVSENMQMPLQVVSLCCHSGNEKIASALSKNSKIEEVIAPRGAFEIPWAVHFVTGYFLKFFGDGCSPEEAVKVAVTNPKATPMCIWRKGDVIHACI